MLLYHSPMTISLRITSQTRINPIKYCQYLKLADTSLAMRSKSANMCLLSSEAEVGLGVGGFVGEAGEFGPGLDEAVVGEGAHPPAG